MKTVVLQAIRSQPTRTKKFFESLEGPGTAYITDSLGVGRTLMPGAPRQWEPLTVNYRGGETREGLLARSARQGYDLLWRVSSNMGQKSRLYRRKGVHYAAQAR